jgi:hypothetical protein
MEIADPMRAKLIKDKLEPTSVNPSTEIPFANRFKPSTEILLPNRAKLRIDMDELKLDKFVMDTIPKRA